MKELIQLWMKEVNRKQALRILLKETPLSLCLRTNEDDVYIFIHNGKLQLGEKVDEKSVMGVLDGKEESFLSIILGERKLREEIKSKKILTSLSYRNLLLIESLFYLATPNIIPKFQFTPSY